MRPFREVQQHEKSEKITSVLSMIKRPDVSATMPG